MCRYILQRRSSWLLFYSVRFAFFALKHLCVCETLVIFRYVLVLVAHHPYIWCHVLVNQQMKSRLCFLFVYFSASLSAIHLVDCIIFTSMCVGCCVFSFFFSTLFSSFYLLFLPRIHSFRFCLLILGTVEWGGKKSMTKSFIAVLLGKLPVYELRSLKSSSLWLDTWKNVRPCIGLINWNISELFIYNR